MDENQIELLKSQIQMTIDLIAARDYTSANFALADASDLLDEILDHCDDDQDLVEISRYQVLLNQLQQKISAALN